MPPETGTLAVMGRAHDPFAPTNSDTTDVPDALTGALDGADLVKRPANAPTEDDMRTVSNALAWVGDDRERAAVALGVEQASERPRVTLVDALRAVLDG